MEDLAPSVLLLVGSSVSSCHRVGDPRKLHDRGRLLVYALRIAHHMIRMLRNTVQHVSTVAQGVIKTLTVSSVLLAFTADHSAHAIDHEGRQVECTVRYTRLYSTAVRKNTNLKLTVKKSDKEDLSKKFLVEEHNNTHQKAGITHPPTPANENKENDEASAEAGGCPEQQREGGEPAG